MGKVEPMNIVGIASIPYVTIDFVRVDPLIVSSE